MPDVKECKPVVSTSANPFRFTVRDRGMIVYETGNLEAALRWLRDFVPTMTEEELHEVRLQLETWNDD